MADDTIVPFTGTTRLDTPPERILQAALDEGLTDVVIVGWDSKGEIYFASSKADGGDVLWLLAKAQRGLLNTPPSF